ncbi:hypothetical protein IC229_13735 [Spirosoma sp. BT702]|uniref:HNH endonuclease 5 domain-containing protein n=1 Tax=Spirosoma profusum TaxID=2771354 RepID=A0A926XW65_9BACT|nr:hypothetical protein [Spirosoma profusum]
MSSNEIDKGIKKCIWSNQKEPRVTFNRDVHTIPQSLGGRQICPIVCDSCNSYFGNPQSGKLSSRSH